MKKHTAEKMMSVTIGIGSGAYAISGDRIEMKRPRILVAPYEVARNIVGKRSFTSR